MPWFSKKEPDDEHLAREYVRQVFVLARTASSSLAEILGDMHIEFPLTKAAFEAVSLAILGTSLAVLKAHSTLTPARGASIRTWSRRSIECDYDLSKDAASELISRLNEYEDAFEKGFQSNSNPFGEVSGMMLVRAFGSQVNSISLKNTEYLSPFIHQIAGDILTVAVTQALKYWQDK